MQETYTDWTLVSLSPWSQSTLVVVCLLVLMAAAAVIFSYRGTKRFASLSLLRVAAAAVVIVFLLEPALQLRVVRKIRNRIALVVDRSRSMTLGTQSGQTRYDALVAALQNNDELEELQRSHTLEWFDLEGPLSPSELGSVPNGEHSKLISALEHAHAAGAGQPLAGMVLLSDGADTSGIENEANKLSDNSKARLKRLGVPINTVDVSQGGEFSDVAVAEVICDEFAFVHNTLEIHVVVESTGFADMALPLSLHREGELVATQEIQVSSGKPATAVFKLKPDKIGEFVYSVSTRALAGEALTHNNVRSFVIQVIRDKIRVLHVAGRPSWDERFLRQHLKENPNVDLISFFILRTPTDDVSVTENEMSLIPFPVDKLFTTELNSFDVVILQNFDYRPYGMARYLRNIHQAVEEGLGFVMIGGDYAFASGGYQGTVVEEILPVFLGPPAMEHRSTIPKLTSAGVRHPVTDLTLGLGNNAQLWSRLPSWTGLNTKLRARPEAAVLVAADGNANEPLIAVMDAGKGRSLAVASDSMWRWRFSSQRDGGASGRAYHRFWANALRWLVRDPEHSRVRVTPSKRRYEVGDDVDVSFTVLGADYQPVEGASLKVQVEQGGGPPNTLAFQSGPDGMATHRLKDLSAGAYRVSAEASASGQNIGRGTGVFVIESQAVEMTRAAPRPDILEAIAQHTGGEYLRDTTNIWDGLRLTDPEVVEIDRRRNIDLWDNAWAVVAAAVLLALEWAVRRRSGYI